MRKITFLLLLLFTTCLLSAQQTATNSGNAPLIKLLDSIRKVKNDTLRLRLNNDFCDSVHKYLSKHITNGNILDTLEIGNVVSGDGNVRILSWNIQQNNGENLYCGFIVHKPLNRIIPLKLKKSETIFPEDKIYRDGDWPAGICYKIIERKLNSGINYTLLTWDGFSKRSYRKTIEALGFDDQGKAVFGAKVFKVKEGFKNRIVFEYSANASFTLQYNRQKATLSGVRRSQRNVNEEMIVFDRLIPMNEELIGQRWAYVPAGNTYDAFICWEGFWTLTEDIAPRNESAPGPPSKKDKKLELDLLPKN
ncbi:MAG: hypothetical protein IPH20_01825 [Bacteroidales bacterium]|nr:hypothetical protein [Bacteroidales bacterium]